MRKRWAETELEFFPGSNMLVHLVTYKLRFHFGVPQHLGLLNFHLLISSWLLYLITSCRQLYKWHESFPQFRLSCPRQKYTLPLALYLCTGSSDLRFCLAIFNYHECLGLAIWILSALFIYLFISKLLWVVQLCYICINIFIYLYL